MTTDILQQIRRAEREAQARIDAARAEAKRLDQETEREVQALLAQAQRDARAQADARQRRLIAQAQEEADALLRQAEEEASRLRDLLARRTDQAAARIVAYILPNIPHAQPADQTATRPSDHDHPHDARSDRGA